jgi:hypothetical protein
MAPAGYRIIDGSAIKLSGKKRGRVAVAGLCHYHWDSFIKGGQGEIKSDQVNCRRSDDSTAKRIEYP